MANFTDHSRYWLWAIIVRPMEITNLRHWNWLISGSATIIDSQSTVIGGYLTGYNLGGLCFDQQSQTYIVNVQNETANYLKLVNVSNAAIIASTPISNDNYFYELQVDNMAFAEDAYNLSSSHLDNESTLRNITIYPNPSSDFMYVKQYRVRSSRDWLFEKN